MTSAALIPDRRRKYFPLNGGPRPNQAERRHGRQGIEAARKVLQSTARELPVEHPARHELTPEQIRRARVGIAKARKALQDDPGNDQRETAAA